MAEADTRAIVAALYGAYASQDFEHIAAAATTPPTTTPKIPPKIPLSLFMTLSKRPQCNWATPKLRDEFGQKPCRN